MHVCLSLNLVYKKRRRVVFVALFPFLQGVFIVCRVFLSYGLQRSFPCPGGSHSLVRATLAALHFPTLLSSFLALSLSHYPNTKREIHREREKDRTRSSLDGCISFLFHMERFSITLCAFDKKTLCRDLLLYDHSEDRKQPKRQTMLCLLYFCRDRKQKRSQKKGFIGCY